MLVSDALDPFILKHATLLLPSALCPEPSLDIYPNPLNSQSTIRYTIPTDQRVIIQVTDFTGRVLQEMDLGDQKAGRYEKPWNPETLKPGAYHVRLKSAPSGSKLVVITR